MRYIFALLFAVSLAFGQRIDLKSQSRNADFSAHAFIKPWVIGTSLPATCSVGDAFFDSDATAGQNVFVCTATNTWTLSSGASTGLTPSRALQSDGSGNVAVSSVTNTELGYLSGVTSAIQTQLNAKQATITGAATTITGSDLTASRAIIANASGKIAVSAVTDTELGYVSGVTSALQTQLNGKLSSTPPGSSGDLIYNNAGAFGALTPPATSLVGTTATQTLTNKTLASLTNFIKADTVHEQVRNDSGSPLSAGTIVYASGYNVGLDVVTVAPADADNAATMPAICIIDVSLSNNTTGTCIESGTLKNVDTFAFSVGDELYVSTTAGVWTATRPTATDAQVQKIGIVVRSHATLGIVQVFGAGQAVEAPNSVDLGAGILEIPNSTTLPATCSVGQIYADTDATSGQRIYLCESANTWVLQGDGARGGLSVPAGNGMVSHTGGGSTVNRTITAGTGIAMANGDGVLGNPTVSIDTGTMSTTAVLQSGAPFRCAPASASGANYTCSMSPVLGSYTDGMVVQFEPDVNSSAGAVTLNINSIASVNIKQSDGTTDPGASALVAGRQVPLTYDGTVFRMGVAGSGSGSTTFTGLTDTPANYTSQTLKLVRVNAGETALEFLAPPTGDLVGTSATQTLTNKTIAASNNTLTIAANDLSDVTITSATEDDSITYQGSAWVNRKAYTAPAAYSSRPAANTVMPGTRFYATDVPGKFWMSDGTNWNAYWDDSPVVEPPSIGWTAVNSPNAAVTTGGVYRVQQANTASQLVGYVRTYPTPPFSLYAWFDAIAQDATGTSQFPNCGIVISAGNTTAAAAYTFEVGIGGGGSVPLVSGTRWTSWTATAAVLITVGRSVFSPKGMRFKIEDNNTNIIWSVWDGGSWLQLWSGARTADFTPSHFGVTCRAGSNTANLESITLQNWDVQ